MMDSLKISFFLCILSILYLILIKYLERRCLAGLELGLAGVELVGVGVVETGRKVVVVVAEQDMDPESIARQRSYRTERCIEVVAGRDKRLALDCS